MAGNDDYLTRRHVLLATGIGAVSALAGCSAKSVGRPAGNDVHVGDDETELHVADDHAVWTWRGQVTPLRVERCALEVRVVVFDESGSEIESKTVTLRDVSPDDRDRRSVSIVLPIERANEISTYGVAVEDAKCVRR